MQDKLATALREMGRIEKTIFILGYISNEALHCRIQRGLNKGEAMNGLALWKKLRERGLQDQLQRASTLNIIINAINVWNTIYLTARSNKTIEEKRGFARRCIKTYFAIGMGTYQFSW